MTTLSNIDFGLLAAQGRFPPLLGRRIGGRAPTGIVLTATIAIVLAVGFDLSSIASISSGVFTLITAAHLRVRGSPTL